MNTEELVFTSSSKLRRLEALEKDLVTAARHTISDENYSEWPMHFHRFLNRVELDHRLSQSHTAHPILQYRLIRRFTSAWPAWRQSLDEIVDGKECQSIRNFLIDVEEISFEYEALDRLPEDAWFRSGNALNILHLMYDIGSTQTAYETGSKPNLQLYELLEVSAINLLHNFDRWSKITAPAWLQIALQEASRRKPYSSNEILISEIAREAERDHPDIDTISKDGWEALHQSVKHLPSLMEAYRKFMSDVASAEVERKLCASPIDRSRPNASYVCFFFFAGPYMPFKYEIISEKPYIAVIHDFVSSMMADEIIEAADTNLAVSHVVGLERHGRMSLSDRLSESAGISSKSNLTNWFDNRIRYGTLLIPDFKPEGKSSGEMAQVINYGIGGYYVAHRDLLEERVELHTELQGQWAHESGNRLATVMVYLRSPRSGGNTVFPMLNVTITPKVGKAIFWFNLNPLNGEALNETIHTACPVAEGEKWVVNKWIREYGNAGRSRPIL